MYYRDKIQNIVSLSNYLVLIILVMEFIHFMNNFNNINNLKHKILQVDKILKAVLSFFSINFVLFWQTKITCRYKTLQRHFCLNNNNNTTKLECNNYLFCINNVVIQKS